MLMMGREGNGYVLLVDLGTVVGGGLKKKCSGSRSWLLVDNSGLETVLDVDKCEIMHWVQIHARDLRILDPILSYLSTILGRERVIVLNLEHIKAIITPEEVLLRDPSDENVTPVVEELKSYLAALTLRIGNCFYPALDLLTSKSSSRNLDRMRKLKSQMTWLTGRVQKVRDELEQLLDDDDDMGDLYLSRKLAGASPVSVSGAAVVFLPHLPSAQRYLGLVEQVLQQFGGMRMMLKSLKCYWRLTSCKLMAHLIN